MTIDDALTDAQKQRAGCMSVESPCSMCRTLEALENEVRRLRAKLARVEALPDKWKARIIGDDWTGAALQLEAELMDACDIKCHDEQKEALRALNDALNDAARRLERAHDEADKYQARALDAEAEVRRLREESNAAGRVLSVIDEMMTSFKSAHSDGEGPNNAEFERLFESILDVLDAVRS